MKNEFTKNYVYSLIKLLVLKINLKWVGWQQRLFKYKNRGNERSQNK